MKNVIIVLAILLALFLLFSPEDNKNITSPKSGNYSPSAVSGNNSYETETSEEYETNNTLEFNGYECTIDCSGHEAGYKWAEEHGITQDDVDNYSGNSNSFMEGMQSYVDENY